MIDFVTLLLVNMMSGLAVLTFFLWWGICRKDRRDWAPVFGVTGLIGTVAGLFMTFTWPIPAPYAGAYGEMSTLLGVLFLGTAWALHCGWRLYPLGIYAFFPGVAAILLGVRIIHLSLTAAPVLSGISFIVTGLGGVFAGLTLWRQDMLIVRLVGGFVMLVAAALWMPTTYMAYWVHMEVKPAATATTDRAQKSGDETIRTQSKQEEPNEPQGG